eukprot:scaffold421364_cov43-Prasinocladus_malaysianus.AAC.1
MMRLHTVPVADTGRKSTGRLAEVDSRHFCHQSSYPRTGTNSRTELSSLAWLVECRVSSASSERLDTT